MNKYHFLTKTFGRLHSRGSHAKKHNEKYKRIERWFHDIHIPKLASFRYTVNWSFDKNL